MIIGLDLSLRCAAAVALPVDFAERLDWSRARWATFGQALSREATIPDRCRRMRAIADGVLDFVRGAEGRAVWIEEMAFARSGAMAREIAGMTWVVRLALHEAGLTVYTVPATSVRKALLGKNPRKDAKVRVQLALAGLECPFSDQPDVADAFAVANWALADHGGRSVMLGEAA